MSSRWRLAGVTPLLTQPLSVSEPDLALVKLIDRPHLDYAFVSSRLLRDLMNLISVVVGRRRVRTLMRRMGIEALHRRPDTSKKHTAHRIYPSLLRHLQTKRLNQVSAVDITYIPLARGFVDLTAVVDCWRDDNYEEACLRVYDSISQAEVSIGHCFAFYNSGRSHSRLNRQIQDQVDFAARSPTHGGVIGSGRESTYRHGDCCSNDGNRS